MGPDRRVWLTGFFNDVVWAYTPDSGAVQTYHVNATPETLAQVRALEFDGNDDLWILNGGTSSIVRLDIASGAYETFNADMYAHSLDLDSAGNIWVNDYFGKPERIGVVDAGTGAVETMTIPSAGLTEANGLPLPYGLQVDAKDRLWVTMLAANTLVRYDTRTGEAKLYQMPTENAGPRRPGLGPDGILWIPEFAAGKLAKFDPESESFTEYDLGLSAAGPYDVEVDQKTGMVWVSGSNDSSIFRFDPKSETLTRYPWPTEPGFIRHIAVDEETGDVWAAYSSYPPGTPKLVRLQPNG
jgi:virginiamycin B lyase